MRANYFGYYLIDRQRDRNILFDIRQFLTAFCNFNLPEYKNQFNHNQENLYLFNLTRNLFILIMTRSNEIIKKINRDRLELREIYDLLDKGDQLGFVSYNIVFCTTFIPPPE
jgi:hypothetical protein